jgi:hypothetical protein
MYEKSRRPATDVWQSQKQSTSGAGTEKGSGTSASKSYGYEESSRQAMNKDFCRPAGDKWQFREQSTSGTSTFNMPMLTEECGVEPFDGSLRGSAIQEPQDFNLSGIGRGKSFTVLYLYFIIILCSSLLKFSTKAILGKTGCSGYSSYYYCYTSISVKTFTKKVNKLNPTQLFIRKICFFFLTIYSYGRNLPLLFAKFSYLTV